MGSRFFRLIQSTRAAGFVLAVGGVASLAGGCAGPEVGTEAKIRLMATALGARERGDLIAAQKAVTQLALLAPTDPGVHRLRQEIEAQLASIEGATSELKNEAKPPPKPATSNVEVVDVSVLNNAARPAESVDYATKKVSFFSTRGHVGTDDRTIRVTFTVESAGGSRLVLIRGVGPSLRRFGQKRGFLSEPQIELSDASNRILGVNSDWRKSGDPAFISAMVQAGGGVAFDDTAGKDAVIVATLVPGDYSVRLSGVREKTGIGAIEIYQFTP